MSLASLPPLSLYIHLPWCVRKCPYCDFNSHAARADVPEDRYVEALLRDLAVDAPLVAERTVQTIFFGGGTPSLFRPAAIARLLEGVRACVAIAPDAEITLEANPGTVEISRFRGFREAGVNRVSIGIQSFEEEKLKALGRIHGRAEALAAADAARAAGFDNFNLDIMYGLPGQSVAQAVADADTALEQSPAHLSFYQLTLEPNTLFHRDPPPLPDEEAIEAMQHSLLERLAQRDFHPYEVSAYAQTGRECRHNRNYWEFGDYLGIGAGAHGKISSTDEITRISKTRHPDAYLRQAGTAAARSEIRLLTSADRVCEFMLNALRLHSGFTPELFAARTGLGFAHIEAPLHAARAKGLLEVSAERVRATELGRRFLNDVLMLFLPPTTAG